MRDFNEYIRNKKSNDMGQDNITDFIKNIAKNYDGKSQTELYSAVIEEAKRRKAAGTLTDEEIDKFVSALSPFLDDKKQKILYKIIEKIKAV